MELESTSHPNPLDPAERDAVSHELSLIAEGLAAEPVSAGMSMPADEQRQAAMEAVREMRALAGGVQADVIGFDEAARLCGLLDVITSSRASEPGPGAPDWTRTLIGAAAKLQQLIDDAVPARQAAYRERLQEIADGEGFAIQHVMGEGDPAPSPPFSYTVGLAAAGHHELAVAGLHPAAAQAILDSLARRSLAGDPPAPGDRIAGQLQGGYELGVRDCPEGLHRQLALAARDGAIPAARQILWPDTAGRLPEDPGADPGCAAAQDMPDWEL